MYDKDPNGKPLHSEITYQSDISQTTLEAPVTEQQQNSMAPNLLPQVERKSQRTNLTNFR